MGTRRRDNGIGDRLSDLLLKNNMSQRELARQCGFTETSISRYVRGQRVPRGTTLANIAKALHTSTDSLLGRNDDHDPDMDYFGALRAIETHGTSWTSRQKAELVIALFGTF